MKITKSSSAALWALAVVATLAGCFWFENYWLRIWTTVLMFVAITQGLNIIVGFAGYHSFGNAAFFGVGAYTNAMLMTAGLPLWLALLGSVVVGALTAAVLGPPLLRLKGHYFAIATVALNAALAELVLNVGGITGGAQGIALPVVDEQPLTLYRSVYLLMFVGAAVSTLAVWWLSRSRFGYAVRAAKDSEDGATAMGINTTSTRVRAWMISAALTAYVGGVWSYWINFIEVGSAFDVSVSVKAYIMMLMGGMGSVAGPVIGAAFFEVLSTLVWSQFGAIHNLMLGVLVCAVVLFLPRGLLAPLRAYMHRSAARESTKEKTA